MTHHITTTTNRTQEPTVDASWVYVVGTKTKDCDECDEFFTPFDIDMKDDVQLLPSMKSTKLKRPSLLLEELIDIDIGSFFKPLGRTTVDERCYLDVKVVENKEDTQRTKQREEQKQSACTKRGKRNTTKQRQNKEDKNKIKNRTKKHSKNKMKQRPTLPVRSTRQHLNRTHHRSHQIQEFTKKLDSRRRNRHHQLLRHDLYEDDDNDIFDIACLIAVLLLIPVACIIVIVSRWN